MAQGGVIGNNTKVGFSLTSPTSYTKIGQLMDLPKFISLVANLVDTTVHSPSRVMTSISGMIPTPEVQIKILADFDQATGTTLETLRGFQSAGTTNIWFRVEVPVSMAASPNFRAWEFQGSIREFTPTITIAGVQTVACTITYGGNLAVWNAGASVLG